MEKTKTISADEYRKRMGLDPAQPSPNKMNARRTEGYASKKESQHAKTLRELKEAGLILGVMEQVSIPLSPGASSRYRLDFLIIHKRLENGNYECSFVDPTGFKTDKKKLNLRMMKDMYGIEVETP